MTRVYRGILLAAGILVASAGSANAQAIGSIFGKVTDPSGGVLPGVTVTVTGPALQRPLVATTSTSGTYQFPSVPIGTFTVTFELTGFKKAARANVVITTNFNAPIDQKMEIGQVSEEMTVTAAAPVVDTKKTTTGAVFTKDILENIPTARDPWQIIGMTPGVQAGLNVGGSASGQQVGLSVYGTSVERAVESRRRIDHRPVLELLAVVFQLRLVRADSGDDGRRRRLRAVLGSLDQPGQQERQQRVQGHGGRDVRERQRCRRTTSRPSCSTPAIVACCPATRSRRSRSTPSSTGGPIKRNRLWWWAAADKQDINAGVVNFFDPNLGTVLPTVDRGPEEGIDCAARTR